ncbi:hypothetical protein Tco_1378274 [Tanacetum coccineum]
MGVLSLTEGQRVVHSRPKESRHRRTFLAVICTLMSPVGPYYGKLRECRVLLCCAHTAGSIDPHSWTDVQHGQILALFVSDANHIDYRAMDFHRISLGLHPFKRREEIIL